VPRPRLEGTFRPRMAERPSMWNFPSRDPSPEAAVALAAQRRIVTDGSGDANAQPD
jgi:hypothetical protein